LSAVRRLAVCDAARQLQLARLRRHPVQAGSDTRTLCLSPQHGPVSSGPRCRRAVSRGRRRDGRSFGFGDRQPTHRSCVAHFGRPTWCTTTPRAVGGLTFRDGSVVTHHPLSIRSASATRLLLCARSLVAGAGRSG